MHVSTIITSILSSSIASLFVSFMFKKIILDKKHKQNKEMQQRDVYYKTILPKIVKLKDQVIKINWETGRILFDISNKGKKSDNYILKSIMEKIENFDNIFKLQIINNDIKEDIKSIRDLSFKCLDILRNDSMFVEAERIQNLNSLPNLNEKERKDYFINILKYTLSPEKSNEIYKMYNDFNTKSASITDTLNEKLYKITGLI